MIQDIDIRVSPEESADMETISKLVSQKAGIKLKDINAMRIVRRSVDARNKNILVNLRVKIAVGEDRNLIISEPIKFKHSNEESPRIVIVGAGPAGLFAALRALELGMKPIVIERGKDVESRRKDIAAISREGIVNPDSNYCFGEGGAGAYSDGKLFTRSKKRGNNQQILQLLYQHGASENILIDSHPHIGSDKLPHVIKAIRQTIIRHGGEVKFNSSMKNLIISGNECKGVILTSGEIINGPVILATGHSARDVYEMLKMNHIRLEAKGFAVGVRLEHPQSLVDKLQYHSSDRRGQYLPAAEYSFVTQVNGRGVYSFCMCPGGVIVPAASSPGELVVNGMSASARAGAKANSGMVVELHPGDFPEFSSHGIFELLYAQKDLEQKFFKQSGNSIIAPAQRMMDFVNGKKSENLPSSTYLPGVYSERLDLLLPEIISKRLQKGFIDFNKKCKGFLTNEAMLVGLESRTSSPLRIPRDSETLQHPEIKHLYPAGEGAGYAGGIVSAALDGQRCVDAFYKTLND